MNNTIKNSEEFLIANGIFPVQRSNPIDLSLPLSEVPDNLLGELYKKQSSYVGWIFYCRTRRQQDLNNGRSKLKTERTKKYLEAMTVNPKVKIKELEMRLDLELEKYEQELSQIECDLNMLDAILKDAEGKATALSREITLRTAGTNLRRNSF